MKLSEFKGEEALDVLADIFEPLSVIFTDDEVQALSKTGSTNAIAYLKPMLKNHKPELISILARLDCKSVEEYMETMNLVTLPKQIMEMMSDPEIQSLFFSAQEKSDVTSIASSSPATESTEAKES